jgi:hypothetical protein
MNESLSHFLEHMRGLGGVRATILSLITAAGLYLAGKVFDLYDETLMASAGIPQSLLLELLLVLVVVCAAVFLGREWGRARIRKAVPEFSEVFPNEVEPIHFRTESLSRAINKVLIPSLFPSVTNPSGAETMPFEEIDKAGALNRYTAIGVRAQRGIVGYASFWPVHDEIGQKLLAGEMNDSDLRATHVVSERDRHATRYAIIPGFGVLHPRKAIRVRAAVVLYHTLKSMIAREYLKGHKRGSLTLIAFPYSAEGKNWCEKLGFVENGKHVAYSDGSVVPVCCRKVSMIDLI